jgi:cytochrome c oxidase assembly protein subunit 15
MPALVTPKKECASLALRRFAWGVLIYFMAVIVWGALVRATGAGAGCGNHWPLCNGTVMQRSASVNTLIEFTHRITSGLSLLAALSLMVWTFRATAHGHLARWAAGASVAFTVMEGILGALLVELGLTAQSQSPLRPVFLALHLTNTLLLLGVLALTAHLLSRRRGYLLASIRIVAPWSALAGVGAVMIVGVAGSMAALGDTLFPAVSLQMAMTQDQSQAASWLLRWRWMHPVLALLASAFVIALLLRAARRSSCWNNRGLFLLMLSILLGVYLLGMLDVLLLAPVWAQLAHLLGADALWVSLVVLAARLTLEPVDEEV